MKIGVNISNTKKLLRESSQKIKKSIISTIKILVAERFLTRI